MSKLYIYKASAGSGKTEVLVATYLGLALRDPLHFRKILAITFTNRATQEMKQRILASLHSMAQGNYTPMGRKLCERYGWRAEGLQLRAKLVYTQILHHYDYFSVSTIDSFFQVVVRNFARELSLPYRFKIETDYKQLLDKIVVSVMEKTGEDAQLRQWLTEFANHYLLVGKPWRPEKALKGLGAELFTEQFARQEKGLLRAFQPPQAIPAFMTSVEEVIGGFEAYLQAAGQGALQHIQQAGLSVADFAYGVRGVVGYLAGLAQKSNFVPTQRSLQARHRVEAWYRKDSPHQVRIISLVASKLQPILQESIGYYEAHRQAYYTAKAIQGLLYAFGLVGHLIAGLQRVRMAENRVLLSEAAHLLRKLIARQDAPFVYEKIGAWYDYFLVDEFQDISDLQWQNLLPLLQNSLAAGHMSLLVGDVKQAIYRWRGSQWQLLSHRVAKQFRDVQETTLATNWRSKPNIVRFNNTFFTQASRRLLGQLREEVAAIGQPGVQKKLAAQLREMEGLYKDCCQAIPTQQQEGGYEGFVRIRFVDDEEGATEKVPWKEQVKGKLPSLLADLQAGGVEAHDIAFLVRNNAEAREISQLLLDYQDTVKADLGDTYRAISVASLQLGQSPSINIIISALTYWANPADKRASLECLYLYQQYVATNQEGITHSFLQQLTASSQDPHEVGKTLLAALEGFCVLPVYECISRLADHWQLAREGSGPFIAALLEAAALYEQDYGHGLDGFLSWWKETGHEQLLAYPEDTQAMRVMTIHQAKGLEFKVVVIPFCAWSFDHLSQKGPLMWCHTPIMPFAKFPSLPIRYHQQLKDTYYAEAYYKERMQAYIDHLNLLYVAFTRAQEQLYVFAPKPTRQSVCTTTADLLYQVLTGSPAGLMNTDKLWLDWPAHWEGTYQQLVVGKPIHPPINSQ
jgi:ATP-dependent exoDNAse (exonuclease V) beta subunit